MISTRTLFLDSFNHYELVREKCNLGLGFLQDDVVRMKAAIEYLLNPPVDQVKFTEPLSKPDLSAGPRNPAKQKTLGLVCKHCETVFHRKAKDEFSSRAKGKEGPFCSQKCSGVWSQSQQKTRGLIHGTTNGYTYYKCRCDECKKAHRNAERNRVLKKKTDKET